MTKTSRSLSPRCPNVRVLVALIFLGAGLSSVSAATSVSQHGITWRFDRDYPTGQFANGDYWVVGPVKIVEITPKTTASDGVTLHGSMIDPPLNGAQAYDSRIINNGFSAGLNVAASLPRTLLPGTALLSSESYRLGAPETAPARAAARVFIRTIAILTVLNSPAPEGSFRPPYMGPDRSVRWNKSQLTYEHLRTLPRVSRAPALAVISDRFRRPWIEQTTQWNGRYLHPGANQPAYGREIANTLAHGLLSLQLDYTNAEKEPLLIRLVQYGIDIYGTARAGGIWYAGGGHNHGRKMPLLLAATALGDPDLLAYCDGRRQIFQEDRQTWYVSAFDVGRQLFRVDGRRRDPYTASDIGIAEWGEQHADQAVRDGRNWDAWYRTIAGSSTLGHVLTARLMGLQEAWNWPAAFDYYDRYWANEGKNAGYGANSIPLFVAEMWRAYRDASVAKFMDENVATGTWENTGLAAQSESFTVSFDMMASAAGMHGVTGVSSGPVDDLSDLAASVRFSPTGQIEASDGGVFGAAEALSYDPGVKYRVALTIDPQSRRYSATVAAPGGSATRIADNWALQGEGAAFDNLAFQALNGFHAVLNLGLQSASGEVPPPPDEDNLLDAVLETAGGLWDSGL